MNEARVDAVLGYALALVAQADEWNRRELGPIHLLKYLYLADLAYAKRHDGESFSGTSWRFHKFGPWSQEAHARIEASMGAIQARARTFPSRYRDEDAVRWSLRPERLEEMESGLPAEVALPLARAVREFGDDTPGLLHHVYRTWPMLQAAPGEVLDLRPPPTEQRAVSRVEGESGPKLSKRKVKKLRELAAKRFAEREERPGLVPPDPPPRYDELWEEAIAQLQLRIESEEGTLRFGDSVWRSEARRDPDVP